MSHSCGFKTIFGSGMGTKLLALVAVAGLVAAFIRSFMPTAGRSTLARGFPIDPLLTAPKRQTPHVALVAGG